MDPHFLFSEGRWLGAGQVTFSISPDLLYFRTCWDVSEKGANKLFQCIQRVEIVGGDQMMNLFTVSNIEDQAFDISLQNEILGTFTGTGVIEKDLVAWEFREPGQLEGYEVYEQSALDEYSMHAEYISSDGARTMIRGKIWKAMTDEELL